MSANLKYLLVSSLVLAGAAFADAPEEPKNWFNDPFFQVRHGIPSCPAPLGPFITEAQRRSESHYRVERGTSCYLEGKCAKPNAYWYDADLGKAAEEHFAASADFADTSLWVTVQRRFVMVEGCQSHAGQDKQIEAMLSTLPDVDRVIVTLMSPGDAKPPYAVAKGKRRSD